MSDRKGCKWSPEEDKQLEQLFYTHHSYREMGVYLGRSWISCKCRLARLQLIPSFTWEKEWKPIGNNEKDEVPYKFLGGTPAKSEPDENSTVFSSEELSIILSWFRSRYNQLSTISIENTCFIRNMEVDQMQEFMIDEIARLKSYKALTTQEKLRTLTRI
jgi:hypothetical protein